MPQQHPKNSPKKGRGRQIATVAVVVVLLVVAAGLGIFWRWYQNSKNLGHNSGSSVSNGQSDGLNQNNLPASVKNAQNLAATGQYDQSDQAIAAAIATTSNSGEKYQLYLQQGVNAENQSKWDAAIAAYNNAVALQKTSTGYIALGRVSEAKGDKAGALSDYQQALPLLDAKDPMYNFDKSQVEAKIKGLGG